MKDIEIEKNQLLSEDPEAHKLRIANIEKEKVMLKKQIQSLDRQGTSRSLQLRSNKIWDGFFDKLFSDSDVKKFFKKAGFTPEVMKRVNKDGSLLPLKAPKI